MSAEIHAFTGLTKIDTSADRILGKAQEAELKEVVIVGLRQDGTRYFASSVADGGTALWHLQRAIHRLMGLPEEMAD